MFGYWESTLQLLVAVGAATVGFWYLADDYETEFVEYLFTDYVVATTGDGPDVEVTVNTGGAQAKSEPTAGGDGQTGREPTASRDGQTGRDPTTGGDG
ncbi:hypothetical protein BRC81_10295 [Halobacteriales archaeon QS_1_68_20]|nr:MAG: hypothetical protein BRC81_10295 [Halobacteriales archaeon QS_1_68_20]